MDDDEDEFEDDEDPMDALRRLFHQLGVPDDVDPLSSGMIQRMMSQFIPADEPSDKIIWDTARNVARQQVSALGPDPTPGSRAARSVADAVHLVELWLSDNTSFPPVTMPPAAWSRAEWIETTMDSWKTMVEPVVSTLSSALAAATESRLGSDTPEEIAQLQSALHPLLGRAIDSMFGAQVGEGLGRAATIVLTGTDLGLPLVAKSQVGVLPTNISALQQQSDLPEEDLLLYCCLREAARQRLFSDIGWIPGQIVALVQHYARQTTIDPDDLASAMESSMPDQLSPETVAAFQANLSDILFSPHVSQEQEEILERLNTLLALVEGWVEHVVTLTAAKWLPTHEALSESLRRHRATNRQAESIVTPFIGMNVPLARIRQAALFWEAAREDRGVEGRDEIWRHPDTLPSPADIESPDLFLHPSHDQEDSLDIELRRFFDAEGD